MLYSACVNKFCSEKKQLFLSECYVQSLVSSPTTPCHTRKARQRIQRSGATACVLGENTAYENGAWVVLFGLWASSCTDWKMLAFCGYWRPSHAWLYSLGPTLFYSALLFFKSQIFFKGMYVCAVGHVCVLVSLWRSEDNLACRSSPSSHWDKVSYYWLLCTPGSLVHELLGIWLCLPSPSMYTGITDVHCSLWIYMGSAGSNKSSHTCKANA